MNPIRQDAWYFTAWRGKIGWIGLAKREPFINGHPLNEPGDVWFEFGATEEEALRNIKRSVGH